MSTTPVAGEAALDFDLDALPVVRGRLADDLRAASCSAHLVRDALVVASELLMNALVHGEADADGRVHASWSVRDGDVTIRVHDAGGMTVPHREEPGETEGGGRGLILVDALCSSWDVDTRGGTTVTAVLTAQRPGTAS